MANTRKDANKIANKRELLYPELSYTIQGCFFDIRNDYGPGQKESIYKRLLKELLTYKGLSVKEEVRINLVSKQSGKVVGFYQPDLVVNDKIVIEIKATIANIKSFESQLYYYLRNSQYQLGYLVNFSTPRLFIKRIVYNNDLKFVAQD